MSAQLSLLPPAPAPDLASYDVLLVNSSAGKDSQAMLDIVCEQEAAARGGLSRIVVVHCDLGRVEWPGTRELAEEQAAHYGVRFVVVSRQQTDLLEHVEARRMWPGPRTRYCTSDHKRAPVRKLMTALTGDFREASRDGWGRMVPTVRILNILGMRAEESPARSKMVPFQRDGAASNGRRVVDTWLPLHGWTVGEVWDRIRASGVRHHPAYDLGIPRLSCSFCIFAPKAALVLAGRHRPELLAEYVRVEAAIGHRFRPELSMADVQAAVRAGETAAVSDWRM